MPHEDAQIADVTPMHSAVESQSEPFVGQWHRLISTTNWEKGRIIAEWRAALIAAAAPVADYADETWSRLVGGVTPQHVGRLRRVYQRFGASHAQFKGLYWSHFQAALDWDDAEMWLEGAVHSDWSVSQMRRQRWETLGALAADRPREEDIVATETDEDFVAEDDAADRTVNTRLDEAHLGPNPEGPDFGDESARAATEAGDAYAAPFLEQDTPVRPFADLPPLPHDLAEAVDGLKMALLRHKADHWREIACEDVLAVLDALKALALAPSVD